MTEQQTAYQRMLDWCQVMTAPATVIPGTRTITHCPLGKPGEREQGTIDHPDFAGQDWLGDNPQQVFDLMEDQLGAVGESGYTLVE